MTITAKVDIEQFGKAFSALIRKVDEITAKTENNIMFEIRDAEREHLEKLFDYTSSSTKNFLSGRTTFVVDRAKPDTLVASIQPREKSLPILRDHLQGANTVIGPNRGAKRLGITGSVTVRGDRISIGGKRLAIPVAGQRKGTSKGRVKAIEKPARLFKRRKEPGFLSKSRKAILVRNEDGVVEVKYALTPQATLKGEFRYLAIARETFRRVAAKKFLRNWRKATSGGFQRGGTDFSGGGDAVL